MTSYKPCYRGKTNIAAQTLFLGASVADFNTDMGWGGNRSRLSVKLVEDFSGACGNLSQFNVSRGDISRFDYNEINHYFDCETDEACYIDENGNNYDPKRKVNPSKEKVVPGKLYFSWTSKKGFASKYWQDPDPGFFGNATSIDYLGKYRIGRRDNSFDIINTPVVFRMGTFTFPGLVSSWEKNYDSGGLVYNLNIDSIDTILDDCYIILDKFAGSVFTKSSTIAPFGAPSLYSDKFPPALYYGKIKQGVMHNVFNVFGFLESFGINNYGGSLRNDRGISATAIIDALSVLTSSMSSNPFDPAQSLEQKRAFSPFGRILLKVPQTTQSYLRITEGFNNIGMGLFPVSRDINGVQRHHVVLDLSELPRLPFDYRISEPVISISQLIQKITGDTGCDFYFDVIPLVYNNRPEIIIKLKTIFRTAQPNPNQIQNTIQAFQNSGINITSSRLGKEKNNNISRVMYIGGNQQRLLQAKSYRLAFTQTNYVYNNITKQFMDYNSLAGKYSGKVKEPNVLSTRNPTLSTTEYGNVLDVNQQISEQILKANEFVAPDPLWGGDGFAGPSIQTGNYNKSQTFTKTESGVGRFFPLYHDVLCPFFGYKAEEDIQTGLTDSSSNVLRRVRPVWMDNFTGQIIVLIQNTELPKTLNVPIYSPYAGSTYFMVSESEIRAAMAGFDSFLTYCVGKIFKPDLFASLYNTYGALGKFNFSTNQIVAESPSVPTIPQQSIPASGTTPPTASPPTGTPGSPAPTSPGSSSGPTGTSQVSTQNIFSDTVDTASGNNGLVNTANSSDAYGNISRVSQFFGGGGYVTSFDVVGNLNFLKDLNSICQFLAEIGNAHYGKTYMARVPEVYSYQDREYADLQISQGSDTFSVYKGSGKIFYNYQPTNDGAWEEYGNFIDDSILVGSPHYYALSDDSGKIKPILGYNASDNFDYLKYFLCNSRVSINADIASLDSGGGEILSSAIAEAGELASKCGYYYYPSINLTKMDPSNFVLKASPVIHYDSYLNHPVPSRRLYHTANVNENFAFLDPENLTNPRAILDVGSSVTLNSSSESYEKDPNLTVLSAASLEDLSIYLKSTPLPFVDPNFVNLLLSRNNNLQSDRRLVMPIAMGNNASYHQLAPKAAHPYFAAIPLKSNQFTYGPWTNYPYADRASAFPDADIYSSENATENLIGGVKVEVEEDFVPWNYGGMRFLDEAVLSKVYNEIQYQQITETATLSIPGLPIFGLASDFVYYDNFKLKPNQIRHNNKIYNINIIPYNYTERAVIPTLISQMPRIGNPTGNPIADYAPQTQLITSPRSYNTLQITDTNIGSVAPVITNISCSISPQSVQTTYSFRTYIQKLGFFNKENNDRLKKNALINIKRNKQLSDISKSFNNKILTEIERAKLNKASVQSLDNIKSGFFGTSPSEVLIGVALPYIKSPINFDKIIENMRAGREGEDLKKYDMNVGADQGEKELYAKFGKDPFNTLLETKQHRTYVGNYMPQEVMAALKDSYSNKSAMSLDGIFSPVSFYPTSANTTYSLRKYSTRFCSLCKGLGKVSIFVSKYSRNNQPKDENLFIKCPSCSIKKEEFSSTSTSSSATSEVLPPYIVTNDTDFNTILQLNVSNTVSESESDNTRIAGIRIPINKISLQPVVVPYGEFRNDNTQEDDRCRHSIRIVGRGEDPPKNPLSMELLMNQDHYYDVSGKYIKKGNAQGKQGHNVDFYGLDIIAKNHKNNTDKFSYLMNQRFFGFRGPMVMHGWGYDMEGYPVPNESDEPKITDLYGRPARFLIKVEIIGKFKYKQISDGDKFAFLQEDEDKNPITDDVNKLVYYVKRDNLQIFDEEQSVWRLPNGEENVYKVEVDNNLETPEYTRKSFGDSHLNPGDIITVQYNYSGSKWVKGPRSSKFYKNWAERPDVWPVGPVDLRWDGSRGVWTIKSSTSPYKMVYITLEEDLVREEDFDETYPARGFLDDIEYSKEPLPNGFRRLVYVKDRTGFTAPKGIKLLCRYDTDAGYYEPVSKPSVMAHGSIGTGNMAIINMHYAQGGRSGSPPQLTTSFENPLNFSFSSGQNGIFSYINGKWNLTSINS